MTYAAERPVKPHQDEGLESAVRIAEQLAASAVWSRGVCAFHGASAPLEVGLAPVHKSFAGDAYEGSAGVARFLSLVANVTNNDELARVARGALGHAMARHNGWSLFSGGAGVALIAFEVATWLDDPALASGAGDILTDAATAALRARNAASTDLISGLAGVVVALTTALQTGLAIKSDEYRRWRAAATALGNHLLATGQRHAGGMSWPLHPTGGPHLCGLGHGASGVALALEALAQIDSAGQWRDAARQARRFERSWFSTEFGTWADLRSETPGYPHMWCHGSVGITAERLAASVEDELGRTDLIAGLAGVRAAASVLASGPCGPAVGHELNASQCHGLSGMADLFISAWQRDGGEQWLTLARACTGQSRRDALRPAGWRCGVLGDKPTPGLMLGLAGIGWAQLRASRPHTIPSAWRLGSGVNGNSTA